MSTKYEQPYKALVVPNPTDVADGTHSVASLEGFLEGSRESRDSACADTASSVFDSGLPHPKQVA
jgi:hypothetical protein